MPKFCVKLHVRIALLLVGAAWPAGCTSLRKPAVPVAEELAPATAEQQAWFDANRDRARYVPNQGYAVEGAGGFYDDQGRPLKSGGAPAELPKESDEPPPNYWKQLEPGTMAENFKKMIGKGPNERVAKAAYNEGDALFRQAKYKEAAEKFRVAYKRGPDSAHEEDAMFKCGESYFFSDSYSKADDAYAQLVKKYPNSQYLDRMVARRFAIARYWEQVDLAHHSFVLTPNLTDKTRPKFDTRGHALRVYDRVRLDDPTGPLADDSVMASANLHFRNARYDDADYYYTLLRHEYPKSEHQYQAHLLGFQSKMRKYQGPQYDIRPLDDADDLAAQLLAQFSNELGEEKERLVEARAWIRASKAQREFEIAEYYHKNKYYAASRLYYGEVARAYPDTKLAMASRTRIDEVKDLPPAPPRPFAWLDKIVAPAGNGLGTTGMASSGLPAGMPATPTGVGTLGGAGAGMPAMGPGSFGGGS
jgi:outer membrane protein assembly factor BamD (BamD/ComL family)